ncbi:MAG: hypothetical protein RIQ79_1709 [Verrucomicrobiota bacterium]|jgi:hypothetical protein
MSDASAIVSETVRPPWPDELRRFQKHFSVRPITPTSRLLWRRVLVDGEYERLAGGASLAEFAPGQGRLELTVRPEWESQPATMRLIECALDQARTQDWQSVVAQVAADTPLAAQLEAAGFVARSYPEVWNLSVAGAIAARRPTIERTLKRNPIHVRAIDESNLAAARTICTALGLLEAERVQLQNTQHEGIDPRFSFLAGASDRPDGIALCRRLGARLYLEVLALNPAMSHPAAATVGALLKAVFLGAQDAAIDEIQCALTPTKAWPVLALLRRGGGVRVSRQVVFDWRNSASGRATAPRAFPC